MHGDDVAVLDAKVVANHAVDTGAAVVKLVVGEHDQHRVLALLALDEHRVPAEQLQRLHRSVGEGDDRVVVILGVGDADGQLW
jgi:hypothetical protein